MDTTRHHTYTKLTAEEMAQEIDRVCFGFGAGETPEGYAQDKPTLAVEDVVEDRVPKVKTRIKRKKPWA